MGRLGYILSHGCKENLVARPQDWPGVHCVTALLTGEPIEGTWFDRTREWKARQRGEELGARQFAESDCDPRPLAVLATPFGRRCQQESSDRDEDRLRLVRPGFPRGGRSMVRSHAKRAEATQTDQNWPLGPGEATEKFAEATEKITEATHLSDEATLGAGEATPIAGEATHRMAKITEPSAEVTEKCAKVAGRFDRSTDAAGRRRDFSELLRGFRGFLSGFSEFLGRLQ